MAPPEVEAPVEPDVPVLLLVPADPPDEGVVAVELPDAPIPDLAPEDVVGEAVVEPEGDDTEPVAEPPVEPIPEAVPDALPVAVVPQAASAAAQITGKTTLIMCTPLKPRYYLSRQHILGCVRTSFSFGGDRCRTVTNCL